MDANRDRRPVCKVLDAAGSALQPGAGLCRELHNEGPVVGRARALRGVRSAAEPVVPRLPPTHCRRDHAEQPDGKS
jgi:hypothetical protein